MIYTHSDKVGNLGDVYPKHPILARVVHYLCELKDPAIFEYVDINAGRPLYALERKGEWKDGAGALYRKLKSLKGDDIAKYQNLKPYIDNCLLDQPRPGTTYLGSSGLVLHVLKRLGRRFRFFLCDTDSDVCADLMRHFPQWDEVTVCRGNGFRVINMLDRASLVFIDPPYMETQDDKDAVLQTLAILIEKKIPLICWTPRVGLAKSLEGEAIYSSFEADAESLQLGIIPVQWGEPEPGKFWGCHLAVSQSLVDIARLTCEEVSELMRLGRYEKGDEN
jgi:23S rRNA A2030 N6-methylase RlmJ